MGRLIHALGARAEQISVALSYFSVERPLHDHRLDLPEGAFVPLPPMDSFRTGVFEHRAVAGAIREVEQRSDVVVVQLPFAAPTALWAPRKPRVYHVCADLVRTVETSPHYEGLRRVAAVGVARVVDKLYRALFSDPGAAVVTNGRALFEDYRPARGAWVVSSALSSSELGLVARSRPRFGQPFRVLFVGHLRPEKGLGILIDAFEKLLLCEPTAELHVVGPVIGHRQGVAAELGRRVESLVERGRACLLGPRNFGPDLFRCFADADVLALPSLMEGTPRVLIEARAFGCPVVASRVGGVPTSVSHETDGLLVPPADADALASALLRLARDQELRARLIEAGLRRAVGSTVEAFADLIFEQCVALLRPSVDGPGLRPLRNAGPEAAP